MSEPAASTGGMPAAPSSADFALHQRVVCRKDGHRGTIRYIGPVVTSKSADTMYLGEACVSRWACAPPGRAHSAWLSTRAVEPRSGSFSLRPLPRAPQRRAGPRAGLCVDEARANGAGWCRDRPSARGGAPTPAYQNERCFAPRAAVAARRRFADPPVCARRGTACGVVWCAARVPRVCCVVFLLRRHRMG